MAEQPEIAADNRPKKIRNKGRRFIRRACIALVIFVLVAVMSWWTMVHMPGKSYRGELPAADGQLLLLGDELEAYALIRGG